MPARQADTQGKGWEQGRRGAAPPEVRGVAGPPPGRMRPRQLAHRRAGLRIRSSHRWCRCRCAARPARPVAAGAFAFEERGSVYLHPLSPP
jgi:hypothetical protein